MLRMDSVIKKYGKKKALNQVTFSVEKGSIHGLVGKNGAGKTTLLKTIIGLYQITEGSIHWDDQPIYENISSKNKLYFMPDYSEWDYSETLYDLSKLHQSLYPNWSEDRYQKLVKAFQLNERTSIKRNSKGEQSLMAFCLALSSMPELLILDEPFDGLDAVIRHQIKNLIIQDVAERQLSVLVSSHNLRELDDLCDCITLIHDGRIKISGELDHLKAQIYKVQIAFNGVVPDFKPTLDILYQEQRGNFSTLVVRGDKNRLSDELNWFNPSLLEILPLSLEELFVYEMEGLNYERKNIIL